MKPGIIVMTQLHGPLAERIRTIQERADPRMLRELPPHVTITGSSGMGPISPDTPDHAVAELLERVARETPAFEVRVQPPMRFMQSNVVVMPIDPNGAIRALHERIKLGGLSYEQPRFTFTPHLTLSFYPELSRERLRELLRVRIDEPIPIDSIQAWRAIDLTRTRKIADVPLSAAAT